MIKMMMLRNDWRRRGTVLPAAVCALIGLFPAGALAAGEGPNICGKTTRQLLEACRIEARDDERVGVAVCLNMSDGAAAKACMRATRTARSEALAECREVREARNEVCEGVGQGPYDPVIDPANFVSEIDNPYASFRPGAFWVYEKQTAEGLEREVLPETREILGVTVTTLRGTVTLDGVVREDTIDWLAQDVNGDVWYFGELVQNFEDGQLILGRRFRKAPIVAWPFLLRPRAAPG